MWSNTYLNIISHTYVFVNSFFEKNIFFENCHFLTMVLMPFSCKTEGRFLWINSKCSKVKTQYVVKKCTTYCVFVAFYAVKSVDGECHNLVGKKELSNNIFIARRLKADGYLVVYNNKRFAKRGHDKILCHG